MRELLNEALWRVGRSTGEPTKRQEGMAAMQALLGKLPKETKRKLTKAEVGTEGTTQVVTIEGPWFGRKVQAVVRFTFSGQEGIEVLVSLGPGSHRFHGTAGQFRSLGEEAGAWLRKELLAAKKKVGKKHEGENTMLDKLLSEMRESAGLCEAGEPMDFMDMMAKAEKDLKKYGPSKADDPSASDVAMDTAKQMGLKVSHPSRGAMDDQIQDKVTSGWKESATLAHKLVKTLEPKLKSIGYIGPMRAMKPGANYGRWFWKPSPGAKHEPWIIVVAQGGDSRRPGFVRVISTQKPTGHRTEWERKPSEMGPKTYVAPRQNPDGSFQGAKGHFRECTEGLDDLMTEMRESAGLDPNGR